MFVSAFDSLLNAWPLRSAPAHALIDTAAGHIHVRDSGGRGPVVLITPDGPNVVAHYDALFDRLAGRVRLVCFDLPGFGHSRPRWNYRHRLDDGATVTLAVMDALGIPRAALAFSCANGFYALAAAQRAPERVERLLLSQTPSLGAMQAWVRRVVPLPVRVPLLGQALVRATRGRTADGWYRIALADKAQRPAFQSTSAHALHSGGCFCLAGVVQGLSQAREAQLSEVRAPVTLLWGDADRSHSRTQAESLHDLVPQAAIEHFPGCGHFPDLENVDRYADRLLKVVAASR